MPGIGGKPSASESLQLQPEVWQAFAHALSASSCAFSTLSLPAVDHILSPTCWMPVQTTRDPMTVAPTGG